MGHQYSELKAHPIVNDVNYVMLYRDHMNSVLSEAISELDKCTLPQWVDQQLDAVFHPILDRMREQVRSRLDGEENAEILWSIHFVSAAFQEIEFPHPEEKMEVSVIVQVIQASFDTLLGRDVDESLRPIARVLSVPLFGVLLASERKVSWSTIVEESRPLLSFGSMFMNRWVDCMENKTENGLMPLARHLHDEIVPWMREVDESFYKNCPDAHQLRNPNAALTCYNVIRCKRSSASQVDDILDVYFHRYILSVILESEQNVAKAVDEVGNNTDVLILLSALENMFHKATIENSLDLYFSKFRYPYAVQSVVFPFVDYFNDRILPNSRSGSRQFLSLMFANAAVDGDSVLRSITRSISKETKQTCSNDQQCQNNVGLLVNSGEGANSNTLVARLWTAFGFSLPTKNHANDFYCFRGSVVRMSLDSSVAQLISSEMTQVIIRHATWSLSNLSLCYWEIVPLLLANVAVIILAGLSVLCGVSSGMFFWCCKCHMLKIISITVALLGGGIIGLLWMSP